MEFMYTAGQEKQSTVLTLMEKYMCLPDIHKVYLCLFFLCFFSIIQMKTGTEEVFSCQVFPLLRRIGFKTSQSGAAQKYQHKSLLRRAQLSCSQDE